METNIETKPGVVCPHCARKDVLLEYALEELEELVGQFLPDEGVGWRGRMKASAGECVRQIREELKLDGDT